MNGPRYTADGERERFNERKQKNIEAVTSIESMAFFFAIFFESNNDNNNNNDDENFFLIFLFY